MLISIIIKLAINLICDITVPASIKDCIFKIDCVRRAVWRTGENIFKNSYKKYY